MLADQRMRIVWVSWRSFSQLDWPPGLTVLTCGIDLGTCDGRRARKAGDVISNDVAAGRDGSGDPLLDVTRLTPSVAVTAAQAADAVRASFRLSGGLEHELERLPGEADDNFLLRASGEKRYVVKFAHLRADPRVVGVQVRMLKHIESVAGRAARAARRPRRRRPALDRGRGRSAARARRARHHLPRRPAAPRGADLRGSAVPARGHPRRARPRPWRENGKKFYLTDRNQDPNWRNQTLLWSYDKMIQFSALDTIEMLAPTPLLLIAGTRPRPWSRARPPTPRPTSPRNCS
jgi:hypothetical protein